MKKFASDIKSDWKKQAQQQKDMEAKSEEEMNPSYWQMMIEGIVRPPRAKYSENQLGKSSFVYLGKSYTRQEHQVIHEGKKIDLTVLSPENPSKYLILYMHGNSSCRVQALGLFKYLPLNVSLACFDFMGCGKNQQMETISLGHRESAQAASVAEYLRNLDYHVILWGRSMGAATALLYGKASMIIADSSFKSFKSLCKQVAKEHSPAVIPNCMITCFFPCVFTKLKKDVDRRAKYDVDDLDVRQAVKKLHPDTVVVFMSGDKDVLVLPRNSQKLHNICPCKEKHLKIFSGDHNSKRPESIMRTVMQLIRKYIEKDIKKQKEMAQEIHFDQIILNIIEDKNYEPE